MGRLPISGNNFFKTAALALAMSSTTAANASDELRLDFGVYSSNKPSAMVKVFRPVLEQLEQRMSVKLNQEVDIRMQIAKNYDQGISDLVDGEVDFSNFGPASYVEAKRMNNDINIIAVEERNNSKVSFGIIAVHDNSPITKLEEVRGKSFAFGDQGSTIGRYLSQLALVQADILSEDLSHFEYLGRHDKVGTALGAGAFDAGALDEKTFDTLVAAGVPIREIARFPNVSKPWIARPGLNEKILIALRESLLEVVEQHVLSSMKIDGFLEGSDTDYSAIRRAMLNNRAFFRLREVPASSSSEQVTAEPAIQSATATSDVVATLAQVTTVNSDSNAIAAQSSHSGDTATGPRHITLNIELPTDLFSQGRYSGPETLTINVKMPTE